MPQHNQRYVHKFCGRLMGKIVPKIIFFSNVLMLYVVRCPASNPNLWKKFEQRYYYNTLLSLFSPGRPSLFMALTPYFRTHESCANDKSDHVNLPGSWLIGHPFENVGLRGLLARLSKTPRASRSTLGR